MTLEGCFGFREIRSMVRFGEVREMVVANMEATRGGTDKENET